MIPLAEGNKLNALVRNTFRIWQETAESEYVRKDGKPFDKSSAGQFIFSDLGTINVETSRGFSAYRWIRDELVRLGVPPSEIAYMQDFKKSALGRLNVGDEVGELGDISVAPILLGWHHDALNTVFSASLTVTAPAGERKEGELAFVGLNYWTFTPAIGFTRLIPEHGLDLSAEFGIDINTRNPDTDYYSGAMAHLDLAVTKSVTENFSVGALAGFLYQFEDDDSALADARDGFKGRSIAVGPFAKYKAKLGERTEIDFGLRWVHEVRVENRIEGDAIMFDITGKF